MWVVVVAVDLAAVFDFGFEAVDGEVQAAEAAPFVGFLQPVDGEFGGGILLGVDFDRPREIQAALNSVRLELVNSHVMRRCAVRITPLLYLSGQKIDRIMLR